MSSFSSFLSSFLLGSGFGLSSGYGGFMSSFSSFLSSFLLGSGFGLSKQLGFERRQFGFIYRNLGGLYILSASNISFAVSLLR